MVRIFKLLLVAGIAVTPQLAKAQSSFVDVPSVMQVCTPVIDEQYDGNKRRWGTCIGAVDEFLRSVGAPSDQTDAVIADLVAQLVELYRPQPSCVEDETELPIAINTAAQLARDAIQQAQIIEISNTIKDCGVFSTAAIPADALPAPAASAF